MLNRKPLALYLAALFVFCVSGCSKRDNDSSGDSGDSAIVECISLDNFSDKAFGEYAISRWDLDGDKCISQSEASKITEIPKQAFKNNNIIESIDDLNLFPSITTLREEAFAGCIKIKTANLKYIQIVEQYTFSGTTYLPNVETVLSHAFEGTSLESVSLPKATYVGECAFVGVSTLKTLDLPNVETVGEYAFFGTSLESVSLPKATYVGDHAFHNASSLTSVDLPNVETVGNGAFFGTSLESVSLPKATYVGDHAFCDVSTLKTLDLPNVETVDGWAFGFTSLESVSLPVETVDGWALSGTSLESVSLPKAIRMCRFLSNENANALICAKGAVKKWTCKDNICSVGSDNKVKCDNPNGTGGGSGTGDTDNLEDCTATSRLHSRATGGLI